MTVILILIVLSLSVAGVFLFAFFWAVKDGQYSDEITPAMRILLEDEFNEPTNIKSL